MSIKVIVSPAKIKAKPLINPAIVTKIAAFAAEAGGGGGLVIVDDTNTRIDDEYLLQFDQNEFYSDCYLIDINTSFN